MCITVVVRDQQKTALPPLSIALQTENSSSPNWLRLYHSLSTPPLGSIIIVHICLCLPTYFFAFLLLVNGRLDKDTTGRRGELRPNSERA